MRRVLKVLVVAAGALPAVVLSLFLAGRLDVPYVTPFARQVLQLDADSALSFVFQFFSASSAAFMWPPVLSAAQQQLVGFLLTYVGLPIGLVGFCFLAAPGIRNRLGGRGKRILFRNNNVLAGFRGWRSRRAERREREEEMRAEDERREERRRRFRNGLRLEDLLH